MAEEAEAEAAALAEAEYEEEAEQEVDAVSASQTLRTAFLATARSLCIVHVPADVSMTSRLHRHACTPVCAIMLAASRFHMLLRPGECIDPRVQELEAMKNKVREMEDEAEKLRQIQEQVEEQMG
eukprot:6214619-Pleurochrysis_carterae.AAC.1